MAAAYCVRRPYCLDRCAMRRSSASKQPIHRDMRHTPRWLKAIALISLAAEATAAAAVFWHSR